MRTNPNSALPAAAPNPAVPSGGLYIQSDPSTEATTPTAYSAVRFNIPEGATGTLTLKLTPSSASTPQTAAISACPTTSPWSAPASGSPGPYNDAPSYTTSAAGCVVGQASYR